MNPSSPTFLSKPSIHDQLRNMSVKLNGNASIDEKEVKDLKSSAERYLTKEATPKTVKIEMEKVVTSADDFLSAVNSKEKYPDVSAESVADINNALDFYNKRKESAPLRQNIVKVGSEMRPRSRQIEEDLKSLEAKNQKTEEGQVLAIEAKVRLMREVVDSENIIEKNRAEIKRLRNELNATSLDKKSLQEKLDQAGKDLEVYEKEIIEVRGALKEVEKNNKTEKKDIDTTQTNTSKPRKVEGGLAGLASVKIDTVKYVEGTNSHDKIKNKKSKQELKPELRSEIKKGLEYEIVKIPKNADRAGFITKEEAEGIRNKLVSDLKVKLLEFKSVEEIDYYVALEQDKLKDEIQNIGLDTDAGYRFYHDMLDGRIRNSDGRLGASFNFLKNLKREELIKGNLNTKKKEGKVFTTTKAGKKMPIDVDDAYMDWKYSKQNDVSEEIANYNRKKNVGFSADKNPASKIEAEVGQAPTPTIPDAPVIGVSAEDPTSISKSKSPRVTKPKIGDNVWGSTVRGLEDSGLRNRINSERDEREDVLNQESEEAITEERMKAEERISSMRKSFEEEIGNREAELRKKEIELIRIQAALEAEKNKNPVVRPTINQPAPKAPEVTDVAPKIQLIDLDEIIEKLKLKKEVKPTINNTNIAPVSHAPTAPTYIRPNTKRLEEKTGKVGLRSAILTAVFAGLMAAGGGYVYGQNEGVGKTTETLTANFNAEKIKDIKAGVEKAQELVIDSFNKGYEKSKIDAAENLLTKEVTPEETKTTEPAKAEEKTTTKTEQKLEAPKVEPKSAEAKPQEPAKKLEWTNKAGVTPKPEIKTEVKSSVDFSDLAGADNKSVEVKRTVRGTVYKLADYGVEGANKDGIEYIANPVSKSVERRNNFCNLKSVESKAFLGFNSLEDAATACLHQLWRYQTGNNKVGLSGDSTLEQMIGKYANLKKEINEDDFESYLKIIQKTYKDYGVKVNQDTKLANLDMSKMLEAISIAENRFYAFDAKSMTVSMKLGVKQEMLSSAGDIMNNGPESETDNYSINNYGQAKYHFAYNPFIVKNA